MNKTNDPALYMEQWEYKDATICNIRRGKGDRFCYTYAEIRAADNRLLVSASLEYCCSRMKEASQYFSQG